METGDTVLMSTVFNITQNSERISVYLQGGSKICTTTDRKFVRGNRAASSFLGCTC